MPDSTNAIYKAAAELWKPWLQTEALLTLSLGRFTAIAHINRQWFKYIKSTHLTCIHVQLHYFLCILTTLKLTVK